MPINRKSLILCVLTAAFVATPVAVPLVRQAQAEDKVKKGELSDRMEEMDKAMKRLRRTLTDAKQNEESLKQIKSFVDAAKACREMTPDIAAKQPEADRAKFIEAYRKGIDEILAQMSDMEKAIKDGKLDKAVEIHGKLKKMEEEGHKKFAPDEGDEKK